MRILVISQTGYGMGIIPYLTRDGHAVTLLPNNPPETVIPSIEESIATSDMALFDSLDYKDAANFTRSRGVKTLGASDWASILDTNVAYKTSIIQAIGYNPLPKEPVTGTTSIVLTVFNGQRFIAKTLVFNYTKLMVGDLGIDVESSGYIAYFSCDKSPLIVMMTEPLEKFLRKAGHKGCFSITTLSTTRGVYVTDISADMNKPYVQAIFENARKSKSDLLLDMLNESSESVVFNDNYVCGVLVSVAPYPFSLPQCDIIEGITAASLKHMWIIDIASSKNVWRCSGLSGCLGYSIARGKDIWEARRRAYRTVTELKIPNIQYRIDIAKDVDEKMYQLKQLKLI